MKKVIIFLLIIMIVATITVIFVIDRSSYSSFELSVKVDSISINSLSDFELARIAEYKKIDDGKLTEEECRDILANPDNYRTVCVSYLITNNSDHVAATDLRFDPIFDEQLQNNIVTYSSNGSMPEHIMAYPQEKDINFAHLILVRCDGLSDEDILTMAQKGRIDVTFSIGNWSRKNGIESIRHGKEHRTFDYDLT